MKSLKVVKNVKATNIVRLRICIWRLMNVFFILFFYFIFVLQTSLELLFLMPVFL